MAKSKKKQAAPKYFVVYGQELEVEEYSKFSKISEAFEFAGMDQLTSLFRKDGYKVISCESGMEAVVLKVVDGKIVPVTLDVETRTVFYEKV